MTTNTIQTVEVITQGLQGPATVPDGDRGDVTVSSNGTSIVIDSDAVTYDKIQDLVNANRVLGASEAGTIGEVQITNDYISSSAAIALSKLATGALPTAITVTSANISDLSLVNADVSASAAIAGTKISPDFGDQNIVTTGKLGVGIAADTEFHVKGTQTVARFEGTGGACYIDILDSDDSSRAFIGVDGGTFKIQTGSGFPDRFSINSTGNATFDGNVGIGASADSSKLLSVNESSSGTNVVAFVNGSNAGYGTYIAGGTDANYALKIANYAGTEAFKVFGDGTTTIAGDVKINSSILEIASSPCLIDLMETSATNHRIRNGSGNFHIQKISDDKNTTTDQLVIDGGTGAVKLYFDGAGPKLESRSDGVAVDGTIYLTEGVKVASHPVVGYASTLSSYATRLGSTGTSTLRYTQIYGGGNLIATFDGIDQSTTFVGDVRFNGSNVSNYLFWDKSADSLTAVNGTITTTTLDVTGNILVGGTVDGIDIATDVAANTAKVTNATHTGEVTGSTALTIADDVVDEANLKISNAGSDGQYLQKQSGNTGGLTWATVSGGGAGGANTIHMNDNVKITFGDTTTPDLEIYHENTNNNSVIKEQGSGLLKILTNGLEVKNVADDSYSAFFGTSGACQLYYGGASTPKVQTDSNGAIVIGILDVNPNANNTGESPILKITNGTAVSGGKNYSLRVNRPGVSNTGFTIYNESDTRNELSIDGSGNASFAGTVTATSVASSVNGMRKMTTSTLAPSGGSDGDVWFKYTA